MSGRMSRGNRCNGVHHGEFKPVEGSFEFTGENANATQWHCADHERLLNAARSFLSRVGS